MSTCILKLYKNTKITPSRNARVDDIEVYLDSLDGTYESTKFQYQRIDLNMSIKVNMDQKEAQGNYDYASIEQDGRLFFFFVMKGEQVSRKCVRFELSMDTINSWWDFMYWNSKTSIQREHMDRYRKKNDAWIRYIDPYNEGMNPAKDRRISKTNLTDTGDNSYLIWISNGEITPDKQSPTPLVPMYCKNNSFTLASQKQYTTTSAPLYVSSYHTKDFYITTSGIGASCSVKIGSDEFILGETRSDGSVLRCFRFIYKSGEAVYDVQSLFYTGDVYPYSFKEASTELKNVTINTDTCTIEHDCDFLTYSPLKNSYYDNLTDLNTIDQLSKRNVSIGKIPARVVAPFEELNRSSTNIAKIIKLPFDVGKSQITRFVPGWNLATFAADVTNGIGVTGVDASYSLHRYIERYVGSSPTVKIGEKFMMDNESKLYSSEFFGFDVTYMNLSFPFLLENVIDPSSFSWNYINAYVGTGLSTDVRIQFDISNSDYRWNFPNQEYFYINGLEVTQYNSSWINYLRNGYNYDETNRKLSNRNAIVSGVINALNIVPLAGSIQGAYSEARSNWINEYASTYTQRRKIEDSTASDRFRSIGEWDDVNKQNQLREKWLKEYNEEAINSRSADAARAAANATILPSITKQGGIGALVLQNGIQAINSAVSSFQSIRSNNLQMQNQLNRMQSSTPTAYPSSYDITNNKVELWITAPRDEVRETIAKVFHYTGYSHPVQAVPDFTSRYYFNFVQCDPVFDTPICTIHPEYEDDIRKRFQAGVTVYHAHDGTYDWNQENENWEVSLIGGNK
mgnify:FL=1